MTASETVKYQEPYPVFTRAELQALRDRAEAREAFPHTPPAWRHALARLADAADHLDAMLARCTIKEEHPHGHN